MTLTMCFVQQSTAFLLFRSMRDETHPLLFLLRQSASLFHRSKISNAWFGTSILLQLRLVHGHGGIIRAILPSVSRTGRSSVPNFLILPSTAEGQFPGISGSHRTVTDLR